MTLISSPATRANSSTLATLVIGGNAASREAAIADALDPSQTSAVILEGIPSGQSILDEPRTNLQVIRIAPGCVCCVGNLTLRVHLNRILRKSPQRLFISLVNDTHLAQVRAFLTQEPYRTLLTLTEEIIAPNN
jgi:hypothetical protein